MKGRDIEDESDFPPLGYGIREGYAREDHAEELERTRPDLGRWLCARRPPKVGDGVKVQINYVKRRRDINGEWTTWTLMGGHIREVIDPKTVKVEFCPSTDNAALDLPHDWLATMRMDEEMKYPWIVVAMEPLLTVGLEQ